MSGLTLTSIQTEMNFYAYPILTAIGVVGNLFALILFSRQRQNSCTIYLMSSSITNLLYLISVLLFKIFTPVKYDQTLGALVFCKFANFIANFLGQVAKTIFILACIDRYMITSNRVQFRAFSTPKRAKYFIVFSYIVWLVVASPIAVWTATINGQCIRVGTYATIFPFYAIFLMGLIPSITLCVFGYLTYRNMRKLHRRVQPTVQNVGNTAHSLQRRDRDLLILVTAEALVYILTTSLYPAIVLETTITSYTMPNKTSQYALAEVFTLNISFLLLFTYIAAPFYVYMISSASFRRDFKQLIMSYYWKATRQTPDHTTLKPVPNLMMHDTVFN